jgi:regulator of sirC expression with transglutaminase-like and TPR domain
MRGMDDAVRRRFAEAAREERPDLTLLCLLIGAAADPGLAEAGMDEAQIELDRLAGLLPHGLATPDAWAGAVRDLLGERCGFGGLPGDYQRLESSLLHEVLRRRRGLPILLSVIWMEVARRAGGPVYGVALPGHFVVGFGDPALAEAGGGLAQGVLTDPFRGGALLDEEDIKLLVTTTTGTPLPSVPPSMLRPADPLDIVRRILNNIRAWAAARPEHAAVRLWAVDLSLELPRHPVRLRYERAQLLVDQGDFVGGATEMESYAELLDEIDPAAAEEVRHRARAARAMLN